MFDRFNESQGDSPIYYFWESENSKDQSNKSYVDLYKWDNKTKIFTLSKEKQELTIWKWWGKGGFKVGDYDLNYFYKFSEDNFLNTNLKEYFASGNETNKSGSLMWGRGVNRKIERYVYTGKWKVIKLGEGTTSVIPAINQSPQDITSENLESIELVRPIYWSNTLKTFGATKRDDTIEIKKYKEYLDFLGFKWEDNQKQVVFKGSALKKS
ncbi:hypothetical protein OVS_01935 [Mycoplasma ovis str. Michigan]|uniref:Uncharacterized protein n=1 Tax=Mycoplasma ovis str. Michigan TaxID=1415773 RepID=A0ABM5P1F2_9MOLU|nr:hypothetical protein [Mycoplasma ovis]AHC40258.1 hypothetical protein OVS_01935 [Mycoplasma ovis str. Michigan]